MENNGHRPKRDSDLNSIKKVSQSENALIFIQDSDRRSSTNFIENKGLSREDLKKSTN